jgi:hypothetical protein
MTYKDIKRCRKIICLGENDDDDDEDEDRETSQTDGDNTFAWPTHSTYDEQRWDILFRKGSFINDTTHI